MNNALNQEARNKKKSRLTQNTEYGRQGAATEEEEDDHCSSRSVAGVACCGVRRRQETTLGFVATHEVLFSDAAPTV